MRAMVIYDSQTCEISSGIWSASLVTPQKDEFTVKDVHGEVIKLIRAMIYKRK